MTCMEKTGITTLIIEKRKQELIAITARMIIKSVGLSPPCHKGVHTCTCTHFVPNVDANIEKKTIFTSLFNMCMRCKYDVNIQLYCKNGT